MICRSEQFHIGSPRFLPDINARHVLISQQMKQCSPLTDTWLIQIRPISLSPQQRKDKGFAAPTKKGEKQCQPSAPWSNASGPIAAKNVPFANMQQLRWQFTNCRRISARTSVGQQRMKIKEDINKWAPRRVQSGRDDHQWLLTLPACIPSSNYCLVSPYKIRRPGKGPGT